MTKSLRVAADLQNLAAIRRFVEDAASTLDADEKALYALILAVDECVTNTIVHGYAGKPGMVDVEVGKEGESIVVTLRDQAPLFDPTTALPPDLSVPLDERPLGGLGIYLTRQFMDRMAWRPTAEGGNELTLVKRARQQARGEEDGEHQRH